MTNSRLWLALSTVASVGTGFLGGMMYTRRVAARDGLVAAVGRLYEVDTETYADGGLVAFLTARADSSDELQYGQWNGWTVLRFRAVAIFIKMLHDGSVFPDQRGALYTVRAENSTARRDPEVQRFLQEMIDLGLVVYGGRWRYWGDVWRDPNQEARR
jgi:hypothetical protein